MKVCFEYLPYDFKYGSKKVPILWITDGSFRFSILVRPSLQHSLFSKFDIRLPL